jgi:polyhydroxybutyrate depolymerase
MRRTQLILGVALLVGMLLVVALTAMRASPILAAPQRHTVHHPAVLPLPPAASRFGPFSEVNTVTVDGVQRTYRSFVGASPAGRHPLLIVLHGRGQSDSSVLAMTGFIGLARQGQAVLLVLDGQQRSWNAGHGCCGFAAPIRHRTYRSSLRPSPMRCAGGRPTLDGCISSDTATEANSPTAWYVRIPRSSRR